MEFFYNTIRGFFFQLDSVIFGLIDDVYSLLIQISRTSIFSTTVISEFSERVFAIAGIFMLFKVTMSLINYVVNPDDFSDKNKGFANIAKRIVISLGMLVLVPYIFKEAYNLQAIILEENTLMHLVFGTSQAGTLPNDNYVEEAGRDIQFTLMSAFLQPNVAEFYGNRTYDFSLCEELYDMADNGLIKYREGSSYIYALNEDCFGEYNETDDVYDKSCSGPLCKAFEAYDEDSLDLFQTYSQSMAQQNYSLLMRKDLVIASVDDMYIIDYKMLISTAIGIAVIYLFILFCIDIAIRSVKLGFLEMISPIPILSYIDPKSGDKGIFKKWFDMCWKTYLDLFLRLFALYLGIYAITIIGGYTDFVTGEVIQGNWLLNVFMIVGILIFVKQLPKIIGDVLGVKLDGEFQLNPLKRFEKEALGGKRLTGLAAGTAIGAVGMATGAGLGRGLAGAWQGFSGNKGWSDTLKAQRDKNATMRTARLNGSTFGGRLHAGLSEGLGTGGELARIEREKDRIEGEQKRYDDQIKSIEDRIAPTKSKIADQKRFSDAVKAMETRAKEEIAQGNAGDISKNYLEKKAEYERLKASGTASASDIATAEAEMNKYLNDTGMKQYMTDATSGTIDDATFRNMRANAEQAGQSIGVTLADAGADIHRQFGASKGTTGDLERSIYSEQQEIESIKISKARLGDDLRAVSDRERVAKANQSAIKK